ncbi:MAG: hypothetical protein WCT85_02325 [Parachlamydiales bacterium]|jgi:hypothetical protein
MTAVCYDPFAKYRGPDYTPFPPMDQSFFSRITDAASYAMNKTCKAANYAFDKVSGVAKPLIFLSLFSASSALTTSLITTTVNTAFSTLYNRDFSQVSENFNQNELIANAYSGLYASIIGLGIQLSSNLYQNGSLPSFSEKKISAIKSGVNLGKNVSIGSYFIKAQNKIISSVMPSAISGWIFTGIGMYGFYQLGKRIIGKN